jgi:repressor LexA
MEEKLKKLRSFYKKHHRLPSYQEMLKIFGVNSKNAVFRWIQKLIEENFLKKEGSKIVPAAKFFALPVLGLVKAGFPILAEENRQYLSLDEYLIEDPNSTFLLRVSGDSLIGAGIFDGDLVIIERKRVANVGDIVLAQIDNEWTLKILRKIENRYYLESANKKYPAFFPKAELKIFGVVKAVVRKIVN